MQNRRHVWALMVLVAGLAVGAIAPSADAEGTHKRKKKGNAYELMAPEAPKPGDTLARYQERYKGLHETGGLAGPGLASGFTFKIYEGLRGKEASFSETFLPCDPLDAGGLVYLPRQMLTVMQTPDGGQFVIGESKAIGFSGEEPIAQFLEANEAQAITRVPPATGIVELLKRWYHRTVKREKIYQTLLADGGCKVFKATLDGGVIESLVMVPDFEHALPESYAADLTPGGILKRVDYLAEYRRIALDDLYPVLFKSRRAGRH